MILNSEYIFKDLSHTETKEISNVNGELLVIQVTGNAVNKSIQILGISDLESEEFVKLQSINMTDFSITNDIVNNGLYQIDISAVRKIRIVIESIENGTVSILGNIKEG